ncbi:MAG: DUF167 domain-containing protein [Microgenomates group bacterium]
MQKGEWSHLAVEGAEFVCRVTPRARLADIRREDDIIHVAVNSVPEDGQANAAVMVALARALGVAKTRLQLIRGHTSREKVFRLI